MSLKDIKFDEALRQEWIEEHRKAEIGEGDVRVGNCMCALGTLGQALVNRGLLEWVPVEDTNVYNLRDPETGFEGQYGIFWEIPPFAQDFTTEVWEFNDRNFDPFDIEASRAKMIEFIESLEVENTVGVDMARYKVEINHCRCHPETCCCNDWRVVDTEGQYDKLTFFREEDAERVCDTLNRAEYNHGS